MAERPILPLEAQAAIERERERILKVAYGLYPLVFQSDFGRTLRILQGSPQPASQLRRPASLKLELKQYSSALFDAEAQHCARYARSDEEMRSWLSDLTSRVENEVIHQIQEHSAAHDFHCTAAERKHAITEGLKERSEYWIKVAETDPAASAVRINATMARARDVLANLEAEETKVTPVAATVKKGGLASFPKRASWLKERLRERAWNKHDVRRYGGPDYKTVQKILDGKVVREDGLEKLVEALNKKKKASEIKLSDVPTD